MKPDGTFHRLKSIDEEARAQGEILRLIRRDLSKMAKCLDELLEIARRPTGFETQRKPKT